MTLSLTPQKIRLAELLGYEHDLVEAIAELERITADHGDDYASAHEAYAAILEELDELFDEIKAGRGYGLDAYCEAIEIAATALRCARMIRRRIEAAAQQTPATPVLPIAMRAHD